MDKSFADEIRSAQNRMKFMTFNSKVYLNSKRYGFYQLIIHDRPATESERVFFGRRKGIGAKFTLSKHRKN